MISQHHSPFQQFVRIFSQSSAHERKSFGRTTTSLVRMKSINRFLSKDRDFTSVQRPSCESSRIAQSSGRNEGIDLREDSAHLLRGSFTETLHLLQKRCRWYDSCNGYSTSGGSDFKHWGSLSRTTTPAHHVRDLRNELDPNPGSPYPQSHTPKVTSSPHPLSERSPANYAAGPSLHH